MSNAKKLLMAAAGAAGGAGLDIPEVFSTYLYTGTDAALTVNNGIDLSGEGGLVWVKNRGVTLGGTTGITNSHMLVDTESGASNRLLSNDTDGYVSATNFFSSFNSNGFTVGTNMSNGFDSGHQYVSWTWRKASNWFDIVTYTGNQVSGRTVSHNLGSTPGMIIIKKTDSSEDWTVWHRDLNTNSGGNYTQFIKLNDTSSAFGGTGSSASTCEDVQNVSSTTFTIGNDNRVNTNNATYVAYLFAHHNSDGGFGPDSDKDIIKCGSYTGNGSSDGPTVNVGFEPQWLLTRRIDSGSSWQLHDSMRGVHVDGDDKGLRPDATNAEATANYFSFTSTGFKLEGSSSTINSNGGTYIYMAIRRGSLLEPTSSTDVFDIESWTGNNASSRIISTDITHDVALLTDRASGAYFNKALYNRLTGDEVYVTHSDQPDSYWAGSATRLYHDVQEGIKLPITATQWNSSSDNFIGYFWKRALGYFDVVTYKGNDSTNTLNHNLGAVPEMIWIKARNNQRDWMVYHETLGLTKYLELNSDGAFQNFSTGIFDSNPTSTQFVPRSSFGQHNNSSYTYIAYLFATLAGISKVGSFSGNNANNRTIDCGFSNGAKFVIVKCTSNGGTQWFGFDSTRGINASGNDPYLLLNADIAEQTSLDLVGTASSGFAVNYVSSESFNETGKDYIFYAVAA